MNKLYGLIASVVVFGISGSVYAQCTGRYIDCFNTNQVEGISVNGDVRGGFVEETRNAIYVQNIKIYQDNPTQALLHISTNPNEKRPVFVKNVELNTKNADIYSDTGSAHLVNIHLGNYGSNEIRDLTINSSGVNHYTSNSYEMQNSAGAFGVHSYGDASNSLDVSRVTINNNGYDYNQAIQNFR